MIHLQLISSEYNTFFDLLPTDWRESITSIWNEYSESSRVYLLVEAETILGGGIVFSKTTPDMEYNSAEAEHWFSQGYLYLGYIFISEKNRGKGLGTLWLQELIKQHPEQKYWLTIEDTDLVDFYGNNGFRFEKILKNEGSGEWLMVFDDL